MTNLSKRNYPPKFQPQKWDNYSKTGCYTYALNIKKKAFFLVGDFIGKRCTYRTNVKDLLKTFRLEVKTLGFSVREIQLEDLEHLKPGEYAIYLKRDKQIGYYHFFRRDSNGVWSHKHPDEDPEEIDLMEEEYVYTDNFFVRGWLFALKVKDR